MMAAMRFMGMGGRLTVSSPTAVGLPAPVMEEGGGCLTAWERRAAKSGDTAKEGLHG